MKYNIFTLITILSIFLFSIMIIGTIGIYDNNRTSKRIEMKLDSLQVDQTRIIKVLYE